MCERILPTDPHWQLAEGDVPSTLPSTARPPGRAVDSCAQLFTAAFTVLQCVS